MKLLVDIRDITSIWFLSSEERDRVFNTMS